MLRAKVLGNEALRRRLNAVAPSVEKYTSPAKLEIAKEAASRIAANAPRATGDYADSIRGGSLADNPGKTQIGINPSKDPSATGVFAGFIWRFLEFGTKGHAIQASAAKNLVFVGRRDGATVLTKKVNHPGSPPQKHIFHVWRAYRKAARRKMLAAVNKGVREAMGKK